MALAVETAADALRGLFAVENNAATASGGHVIPSGDLDVFTPDVWDRLVAVNLRGPFLIARAATAHLRASGQGRFVNVGSTISKGPWGAAAIYAPSKGAVEALTRYPAASLAPEITVNMIAPGLMEDTDTSSVAPADYIRSSKHRAVLARIMMSATWRSRF